MNEPIVDIDEVADDILDKIYKPDDSGRGFWIAPILLFTLFTIAVFVAGFFVGRSI